MIFSPEAFLTNTMRENSWGNKVARILASSLAAVEPGNLVREVMHREKNQLTIDNLTLDLEAYGNILLIGIGKASIPMTTAAADVLGKDLSSGILLSKKNSSKVKSLNRKVETIFGGHPVPDQSSLIASDEIFNLTKNLTSHDLVLVLLSGGGSSLLTAPAPGISLKDLQNTNQVLLGSGADILEINTVRKHLSAVKGGLLAKAIHPARLITLVLSDVMTNSIGHNNSADMVASGPTMADPSTFQDAIDVINFYLIKEKLPISVIDHLELGKNGKKAETPKPGEAIFDQITSLVIGNNDTAVEAGILQAIEEGFNSIRGGFITGEAKEYGNGLAAEVSMRLSEQHSSTVQRPSCYITGGESTVTLPATGNFGKGGRNLELALSAMPGLANLNDVALITLASDGEDGVADAAGAIVTGDSYQRALDLGIKPEQELIEHNSFLVFDKLGDLIITGPTFTNVNDLCFMFYF